MGSKLILLLSLLVGAFLTFMCVNENKTALSAKYSQASQSQSSVATATPAVQKEVVIKLGNPSFSYSTKQGTILHVKLSEKGRTPNIENFISTYCPADSCTQDIIFDKNTKEAIWQDDAIKIASFLKDKDVKNGVFSISDNIFNLGGELKSQKDMDQLNVLITPFDPETFKMENITTVAPKVIQITKPKVVQVKQPEIKQPEPKLIRQQAQSKIIQLLKTEPVYFELSSAIITQSGKLTLDKIIATIENIANINLRVEGHTDAAGNKSYNQLLSQQRADAVKTYLSKSNLKKVNIESIGFGETKPISSNPRDKINRRVEIYLEGGE